MKHYVEGTTCDMGNVEKEFDGPTALRDACIKAQNIEEDGGSATVTDEHGNAVDHWAGYQVGLDPASGTDRSVGLIIGPMICEIVDLGGS